MGADEKLYELLAGDREIPWAYAAGHYMLVKVSSGGFLPEEADEVVKIASATAKNNVQEQMQRAAEQGLLSGVRGLHSGDVAAIGKARRTRAARIGDLLGMAGGTATGLLATRKSAPAKQIMGAALGLLGGKALGKTVGTEIDAAKIRARLRGKAKAAEIEKKGAEETTKRKLTPTQRAALLGAGAGALTGLGYGSLAMPALAKRKVQELDDAFGRGFPKHTPEMQAQLREQFKQLPENVQTMVAAPASQGMTDVAERNLLLIRSKGLGPVGRSIHSALTGAAIGALTGAAMQKLTDMRKEKQEGVRSIKLTPEQQIQLAQVSPQFAQQVLQKRAAVERVHQVLRKIAQRPSGDTTITSPVTPMPSESPLIGTAHNELHPEIEAQLAQMQQQNESEFYRQQAAEAQQQADLGRQRVEELVQQINMLNQQTQQQLAQDQQVRQMAEQQAQTASQEAMTAKDESLQAQQQNMQLRAAVTQFRQALMNLVAQDPTMAMGPPAVQTGPAVPPEAQPEAAQQPPPEAAQVPAPPAVQQPMPPEPIAPPPAGGLATPAGA